MMYGSMMHDFNGRKRKTKAYRTRSKGMNDYNWNTDTNLSLTPLKTYVRDTQTYPSMSDMTVNTKTVSQKNITAEEKVKISSQYTIAPTYNKGAYMVIPRNEVESIGK